MKIIVMNVPGHGHVNPTLPVVQELVEKGVQVLYYNTEEFRAKISETGAEFRAYPPTRLTSKSMAHAVNIHLINVTHLLLETSLSLTVFMLDEVAREQPDLLIFDSICLWGMQAARLSGLLAIASITTFILEGAKLDLSWRDRWHMIGGALPHLPKFSRARSALIQRYGRASLPPKHLFPCTGQLNLVYTTPALQPPTRFIDHSFVFVGPALPPPSQPLDFAFPAGQVIYISLGTVHTGNREFFEQCFVAFAHLSATFVVAAGPLADQLAPPPNFIVRRHVPQVALLPHVDLFITHAGINSMHESLYFGVPMVMVPQQMEQAANARIAAAHGTGVVIGGEPPYGQAVRAEALAQAVQEALTTTAYRAAAQRMKDVLQATGGAAHAVETILAFAATQGSIQSQAGSPTPA